MPGPKPKPTALKIFQGNPGKRKLPRAEPKPLAKAPPCPAFLGAVAKAKWATLVPELSRLGLLTIIDGDTLSCYCQAWAEFEASTRQLEKKNGRFITIVETGYVQPHPAVAQQRSAWAAIKSFASLFGLDPSSRSRLDAGSKADGGRNELDDFLNS